MGGDPGDHGLQDAVAGIGDREKFDEGLRRNGPQAVEDFDRLIKKQAAQRAAPSEDVAPRIPGSFYKTEEEEAKGKG